MRKLAKEFRGIELRSIVELLRSSIHEERLLALLILILKYRGSGEKDIPDRYWYGARPQLLKEFRGGKEVDILIESVDRAAKSYPWPDIYNAFPGPNSNTFTAWVAKRVPELNLELPFSAIGSGY